MKISLWLASYKATASYFIANKEIVIGMVNT